ncbi:MAG: phasin family protein [Magnetospirillum sp.]|nr:phasin family protein [Magnetospirillum sp.]
MSNPKAKTATATARAAAPAPAATRAATPAPAATVPAPAPVAAAIPAAAAADTATPVEPTVAAVAETIAPAVATANDTVDATATPQDAALKGYEDAVHATRENLDAVVKATTIFARGLQDLGRAMVGLGQETIEEGIAASKQMMTVKTIRELVDIHAETTRARLDRLISEGSRLSDQSVKLVEEALHPINERVTKTVNKLIKND